MANQPTYRSQVLDHLGLVAGMFDELAIGDIIDQATQQNPEKRDLTLGEAVKVMVLNGLPGATEQKPTRSRPVCWTLRSGVRPACMSEVLSVVPTIRWQPEGIA
jgi:hypothetical protein